MLQRAFLNPATRLSSYCSSRCLKAASAVLFMVLLTLSAWAAEKTAPRLLYPGFPPLEKTEAFKQYQLRPKGDLSKLVYLIDRFAQSDIEIIYEGLHVPSRPAAAVAKWFLSRNYKKQTPGEWIYQWCNRTIPNGRLVLVKLPDGSTLPGRDVLFNELAALEAAEKKTPA